LFPDKKGVKKGLTILKGVTYGATFGGDSGKLFIREKEIFGDYRD